jgi:hypothetical protein
MQSSHGGGSDVRWEGEGTATTIADEDVWFEVDFPNVVSTKAAVIARTPELSSVIEPFQHHERQHQKNEEDETYSQNEKRQHSNPGISSSRYRLLEGDLTDVKALEDKLVKKLKVISCPRPLIHTHTSLFVDF